MFSELAHWGFPAWLLMFADVTLKGSLVLLVVALLAWRWRGSSAATRHLLWGMGLSSFVLLPVLDLTLPSFCLILPLDLPREQVSLPNRFPVSVEGELAQLPVPNTDRPPVVPSPMPFEFPSAVATPVTPLAEEAVELPPPPQEKTAPATPPQNASFFKLPQISLIGILVVWSAVLLLGLSRLPLGYLRLTLLRRKSSPVVSGPLWEMLQQLMAELSIQRPILLMETSARTIPMTWGTRHPVILLPKQASAWSENRLRVVLLHELAHVRRFDCLTQMLAYLIRAVNWFNPLVWLAVNQLRLEQERACDDVVLEGGAKPSDYAEHLLALVTGLRTPVLASPVSLAISRRKARLHQRIAMLLDEHLNHRPAGKWHLGLALLLGLGLFLPLAPIELRLSEAEARPAPQAPEQQVVEGPSPFEKTMAEVRSTLLKKYIKKLDDKKLTADAIKGILSGLDDPYADFFDADTFAQLQKQFQGEMAGIGILVKMEKETLKIVTPLEDSPALKAGIRPGDIILAINGKTIEGLPQQECLIMMRGKVGSELKLAIQHEDNSKENLTIRREMIKLASVRGFQRDGGSKWDFLLDPANKIGYVQIAQFNSVTADEVSRTVKDLQKQGMNGLILDLRNCPGGLMHQAVAVADLFLSEGTIVTIKDQEKHQQTFKATRETTLGDFPLVVLINQFTASSGEIVAGALQDNKRAVLVGSRTFGKGSVQAILNLKEGGALKMTTAYHYLPSGRNIQKKPGQQNWGIDPDEGNFVLLTREQMVKMEEKCAQRMALGLKNPPGKLTKISPEIVEKEFADPQLAAALKALTARITTGKFIAVGHSKGFQLQQLKQLEQLQKQQKTMQEQLTEVQRQITELEQMIGGKENKN